MLLHVKSVLVHLHSTQLHTVIYCDFTCLLFIGLFIMSCPYLAIFNSTKYKITTWYQSRGLKHQVEKETTDRSQSDQIYAAAYFGKPLPQLKVDGLMSGSHWQVWKWLLEAYASLTDLQSKGKQFQVNVFISCMGAEGVRIMDTLLLSDVDRIEDLLKIFSLFDHPF